jgi:hypothetical protein
VYFGMYLESWGVIDGGVGSYPDSVNSGGIGHPPLLKRFDKNYATCSFSSITETIGLLYIRSD